MGICVVSDGSDVCSFLWCVLGAAVGLWVGVSRLVGFPGSRVLCGGISWGFRYCVGLI